MKKRWLDQPGLDWLAVIPAVGVWWLPEEVVEQPEFFQVAAGVLALMAAVVTFACSALYQSRSRGIQIVRLRFGPQLRAQWRACIRGTVLASFVGLGALLIGGVSVRAGVATAVGACLFALVRTSRAVEWMDFTFKEEDREIPGIERRKDVDLHS